MGRLLRWSVVLTALALPTSALAQTIPDPEAFDGAFGSAMGSAIVIVGMGVLFAMLCVGVFGFFWFRRGGAYRWDTRELTREPREEKQSPPSTPLPSG